MYLYNRIYQHLLTQPSKCIEIALTFDISQHTASGTLSHMKQRGMVTSIDGIWHIITSIDKWKSRIDELWIDDSNQNMHWFEGWLSGLVDGNTVNEDEFDSLMEYIHSK